MGGSKKVIRLDIRDAEKPSNCIDEMNLSKAANKRTITETLTESILAISFNVDE